MKTMVALVMLLMSMPTFAGPFEWMDQQMDRPHPVAMKWRGPIGFTALVTGALVALNIADRNDKLAHCAAGMGLSTAFGMAFQPAEGWAVSVGIGALKEQHDHDFGGNRDYEDFAATAACGAIPYAVMEGMR